MMDFEYLKNASPFFLLAGPCSIESEEHALYMAGELVKITKRLGIPFVYKSSFEKANRTSIHSFKGIGINAGLNILKLIKQKYNIPIITDVHECWQVDKIVEFNKEFDTVVNILQCPSYLARQTPLLLKIGESGLGVNIKKPQFGNSVTMEHAFEKVTSTGNNNIILTERGNMFGYDQLIVDFTNLVNMRKNKDALICCDCTHSVQQPNRGISTHGQRDMVPTMARCAVATGVHGIFLEVHDKADQALSDSSNQLFLKDLEPLLIELINISNASNGLQK
jgi:2-dehydro-3-deoxyphosphooctonate aldolase (KDO 8-P synthase)